MIFKIPNILSGKVAANGKYTCNTPANTQTGVQESFDTPENIPCSPQQRFAAPENISRSLQEYFSGKEIPRCKLHKNFALTNFALTMLGVSLTNLGVSLRHTEHLQL